MNTLNQIHANLFKYQFPLNIVLAKYNTFTVYSVYTCIYINFIYIYDTYLQGQGNLRYLCQTNILYANDLKNSIFILKSCKAFLL